MAADIVLFVFLAACVYTDLRSMKVYNAAVISAVILGAGLNYFYGGITGLGHSLLGLVAGFVLLVLFYALGGVGAGDVKFMAAAGCLKGAGFVLMGGLYGAVIGGIAAIAVMAFEHRLFAALKKILTALLLLITFRAPGALDIDTGPARYLPYTVFLSLGMLIRWAEVRYFLSGFIR